MKKRYALFLFPALGLAYSTAALACSPPDPDIAYESASVTSLKPAEKPPMGSIQLKIDITNPEQIREEHHSSGKVTLQVKKVLSGTFSASKIRLNTTNVDNCNSTFEPLAPESYITAFPMVYSDGKPILDRQGVPEYGAMFYIDTLDYFLREKKESEYGEYSKYQSSLFHDLERYHCFFDKDRMETDFTEATWRKCVAPGEYLSLDCEISNIGKLVCKENDGGQKRPLDLRRGYGFWGQYGATAFILLLTISAVLSVGYFSRKRRLVAS